MKIFIAVFFFLIIHTALLAQIPDSVKQQMNRVPPVDRDTLILPTDPDTLAPVRAAGIDSLADESNFIVRYLRHDYPNPRKAALLSVLPGGGQLYNKRYWKLPLVYGAYGGIAYLMIYNLNQRKSFNAAYAQRLNLADQPLCDALCQQIVSSNLSTESVRARRASQLKQLQLSYVGVFAVVVLAAADAFVDAHLKSFNVDDDLSWRIKPLIHLDSTSGGTGEAGLALVLRF